MRILLVEDNPGDVRLIREHLAEAGFSQWRLDHVASLGDARARLMSSEYEVVLLDLTLPDSRGLQTFDMVRGAAPHLPIVILTSRQDEDLAAEAVRRGAQDFLSKGTADGLGISRALRYAVERQRLLQRTLKAERDLRAKTRELEAITDTLATFLVRGEWQEAVGLLVDRAAELTESPVALVGALEAGRFLRVFAGHGATAPQAGTCVELANDDGLARLVETGQAVCVSLADGHAEWEPVESMLAVPLVRGGAVAGVLAVAGRPGGYRTRDMDTLATIARAGDVLHQAQERHNQQAALAERLRESQKMEAVGTLASGVAHHFNNLLMVMMGHAEMLVRTSAPGSTDRHHAEAVRDAGKRAAALVAQMKSSRTGPVLRGRARDLNDLTAATLDLVRCVVPPTVPVRFDPYPAPSLVDADPAQLEQVLLNLIVNARDAMPAGGEIRIETSQVNVDANVTDPQLPPAPGRYAVVSVSDTGVGIDPAALPRVFEPFFTTKAAGRGTGLGLFAVYGAMKEAGGHVSVDSEPGRGTTVRVYLPRADAPSVEPVDAQALKDAPQGRETILVVEDDGALRDRVAGILRRSGYTVLEATDGGEALSLAAHGSLAVDLLVTEPITPTAEGAELKRRLESLSGRMKVLYIAPTDELTLATRVRELLDQPFTLSAH